MVLFCEYESGATRLTHPDAVGLRDKGRRRGGSHEPGRIV